MPQLTPILWIEWQISHYQERYEQEQRFEVRVWLRKELHNLKIQQQAYLN